MNILSSKKTMIIICNSLQKLRASTNYELTLNNFILSLRVTHNQGFGPILSLVNARFEKITLPPCSGVN